MTLPDPIAVIGFVVFVAVVVAVGVAAEIWGVDSRSPLSNDHNR